MDWTPGGGGEVPKKSERGNRFFEAAKTAEQLGECVPALLASGNEENSVLAS